ncbi:transposase [Corynebacterium sp. zg254]|uniref:Transposase n=1 Tax=Corynebacterium zhongnanshanii TaxID=2768834 RepID=A0ABQ6VFB2_9CORY|nr:transposase [Corynebacterium zhongnanshanii]MCR5913808.1 transposase [Corynebacterium sp. zg254]
MVIESDRPITRVVEEIGVSAGLLCRWVKNERERLCCDDHRSLADLRAESARLCRELAESQLVNEFLSKAAALFAAKQRERKSSN